MSGMGGSGDGAWIAELGRLGDGERTAGSAPGDGALVAGSGSGDGDGVATAGATSVLAVDEDNSLREPVPAFHARPSGEGGGAEAGGGGGMYVLPRCGTEPGETLLFSRVGPRWAGKNDEKSETAWD